MKSLCLYQFAMCYRDAHQNEEYRNKRDVNIDVVSSETEDSLPLFERQLPQKIQIGEGRFMVLRQYLSAVEMSRFSSESSEHEKEYSRMLVFCPWENEETFFREALASEEHCHNMYNTLRKDLDFVETECYKLLRHNVGR